MKVIKWIIIILMCLALVVPTLYAFIDLEGTRFSYLVYAFMMSYCFIKIGDEIKDWGKWFDSKLK